MINKIHLYALLCVGEFNERRLYTRLKLGLNNIDLGCELLCAMSEVTETRPRSFPQDQDLRPFCWSLTGLVIRPKY